MEEFSNMAIAAQIKVLREQREWTQKELAYAVTGLLHKVSLVPKSLQ
jgi:predicted hydrolase (HD superfamily)